MEFLNTCNMCVCTMYLCDAINGFSHFFQWSKVGGINTPTNLCNMATKAVKKKAACKQTWM